MRGGDKRTGELLRPEFPLSRGSKKAVLPVLSRVESAIESM